MTDDGPSRLPVDVLFDLLAVERRRLALYHLATVGTCSLDDLVAAVANAGADCATPPGAEARAAVAATLAHAHLPRLVDAGVVAFDRERGRVEYRPTRSLAAWLDWARDHERSADPVGGESGDVVDGSAGGFRRRLPAPEGDAPRRPATASTARPERSDRATGDARGSERQRPDHDERHGDESEEDL
jgi:hypothetical protein